MVVYNITFNVDDHIMDLWKEWLSSTYIPLHYDTGLFTGHMFSEVMVQEELGGTTFSLQFFTPSEVTYRNFIQIHSDRIDDFILRKFGDQFVFFKSKMNAIDHRYPQERGM